MSEERRIQSAPAAPPVPEDEIPIDDEVSSTPAEGLRAGASDSKPPIAMDRARPRKEALGPESPSARRVRTRMTLRIPDDEVGRPTPLAQPAAEPIEGLDEIKGHRIISVGPPPPDEELDPTAPTPPVMPAAPRAPEESWSTSYQPTIADVDPAPTTPRDNAFDPEATGEYPTPISEEIPVSEDAPPPLHTLELDESALPTPIPPKPASMEPRSEGSRRNDGPGANAASADGLGPRRGSSPMRAAPAPLPQPQPPPRLPKPSPVPSDIPPVRPRMSAMIEAEEEEVHFDDESSVPTESFPEPRVADRKSEPGDAAEIAPEDLVSVESVPRKLQPPAPPTRPRARSVPPPAPSNPPPQRFATPAPAPVQVGFPTQPALAPPPPDLRTPASPELRPAALSPELRPAASPQPPAVAPSNPPAPPRAPLTAPMLAAPLAAIAEAAAASAPPRLIVPQGPGLAPPAMTLEAAQRKRTRPWWEELFNDDFIRASAKITDAQIATEVNFIEESLGVAREGSVVLDLACGVGLHAIELARRGYHVVGYDLSLAMLARAADEAQDRGVKLNFLQGDMRDMTFDEAFDGVFCWNTSFGYFEEDKNAQVVSRVHRALKPGGIFLLDVVNRDYVMRQSPSLAWFEGDGCVCMDEMQVDFITSRMKVKRTMMLEDGRTKEIDYTVRVYSLHELGRILHEQGFKVAEVSGRVATPGVFFGSDSPRTLILAEKR